MQNIFVVLDIAGYLNALMSASQHYAQQPTVVMDTQVTGRYLTKVINGQQYTVYESQEEDTQVTIPPIEPLNRTRAMMLLKSLVNECLSQSVRYRTPESAMATVAQALRDCAIPERHDLRLAEDYLGHDLVDTTIIDLHRQIGQYITGNQWRQWDLIDTPMLIGMVGGQDYRIAEWERWTGFCDDDGECLTVNIRTLANYIHEMLVASLSDYARRVPLRPMLADAICRQYPNVSFRECAPVPDELIQVMGMNTYEDFYQRFVDPVMRDFGLTFLFTRIDAHMPYTAEISQDYTLRFYHAEVGMDEEARYCEELRASVERGDWIPERERRRLEEYKRLG